MAFKSLSPTRVNDFLDTCAFDPKYAPESEAAAKIRKLGEKGAVNLILAHSNQKEIEHPNTPADVKKAAAGMITSLDVELNPDEKKQKAEIHKVMTGNGKLEKYAADAAHVFEAGKYGGYFITTDDRILDKRDELQKVSGPSILKPSEWIDLLGGEGAA